MEVYCYFAEATIQDGSCDERSMEEKEYLKKHHWNFKEVLAELTNCSYEDFLKNYTHDNFFGEHPYSLIDRDIVDMIKEEDLALFINREWMDSDAEQEYKRRLSEGSTVKP